MGKEIVELARIAKIHLSKPKDDETFEQRVARFDEISSKPNVPFTRNLKARTISAFDRDSERLDMEANFTALAAPIGSIGAWLPKRVTVLEAESAIVEYVSNVDDSGQKKGDILFSIVVNGQHTSMMYDQFDHALLHYLSVKHEGRGAAFNSSFVSYAMAMLTIGEKE